MPDGSRGSGGGSSPRDPRSDALTARRGVIDFVGGGGVVSGGKGETVGTGGGRHDAQDRVGGGSRRAAGGVMLPLWRRGMIGRRGVDGGIGLGGYGDGGVGV